MKRSYYIFTAGKLRRKDNTVFFMPFKDIPADEEDPNDDNDLLLSIDSDIAETETKNKMVMPIADIDCFYIMSESSFNTRFLEFCNSNQIPIHFFNRYGFYTGSFYPKEFLLSGDLLINQVSHYKSSKKRMAIAKKFVEGGLFNILKNLRYYNNRDCELTEHIQHIENLIPQLENVADIPSLMSIEGQARKKYYNAFNIIIKPEVAFNKRTFHPPDNPINALISYLNSMVYTAVLTEIYKTQLNPTVSFLHEPSERRFSLALDIAEIFKPIFADRLLFKLFNTKQLNIKDFESGLNGGYLKENARKTVVQEFDSKLKTTIMHRTLQRSVSYRRIIRLECYKLIKHLTGDKEYEPFKIWW